MSAYAVIDFHIHAFPDKIAEKTLSILSKTADTKPCTDGSISDTVSFLHACGIDAGVLMQIATKPSQQTTVNNWAASVQNDYPEIFCFGSVHPDAPDAIEELYRIRELGLKGVKLHPDYQNFFINEERLFPIYETISKLRLPCTFHTGYDPISPNLIHAPAKAVAEVCQAFPEMTVIAAHMGNMNRYDDSETYLAGQNLYLDTSMSAAFCSPEQFRRIIKKHGANKILFATDCPWGNGKEDLTFLKGAGFTQEELELILHKNAERILGISAPKKQL